jgi:hypothetical protein
VNGDSQVFVGTIILFEHDIAGTELFSWTVAHESKSGGIGHATVHDNLGWVACCKGYCSQDSRGKCQDRHCEHDERMVIVDDEQHSEGETREHNKNVAARS